MTATDDFRFHAHELMVDLDAATTEMMKLISAHQLSGPEWERSLNGSMKRMKDG